MNKPIETGFGFTILVDETNKNIEIKNSMNDSTTIITPLKTVIELWY